MYQVYAYGKNYDAEKNHTIYLQQSYLRRVGISFCADDGVRVEVAFIYLLQPDASITALI